MKLVPTRPPGRSTRKARSFAAEIGQLRAQGYTFEAIREALAAAGTQVSNSTVQRELARSAGLHAAAPAAMRVPVDRPIPPSVTPPVPQAPATLPSPPPHTESGYGRDIAEAFMHSHITNPLIRSRGTTQTEP